MIKKKKNFIKKKKNMLGNIPLNFYAPEVNLENANQHINTAGEAYGFSAQTLYER